MIHVGQMAQLVHHHIIQHPGRGKHQPPVEGQRAAAGAASPAGVLPADGDAAVAAAGEGLKIGDAPGDVFGRRLAVAFFKDLLLGHGQILGESQHEGCAPLDKKVTNETIIQRHPFVFCFKSLKSIIVQEQGKYQILTGGTMEKSWACRKEKNSIS